MEELIKEMSIVCKHFKGPSNEKAMFPYFTFLLLRVAIICRNANLYPGNPIVIIKVEEQLRGGAMGLKGSFEFVFTTSDERSNF